ncbi:hypothetical protein [Amycolatopsis sp. NPDC098790]|uniref:hypothetical protein n=1 Tax=Amycolatopsis sp. NPDC098790 TaxID=3363939 RepID=UPI0038288849
MGRDHAKAENLGGDTTTGKWGAVPAGDIVITALLYDGVVPLGEAVRGVDETLEHVAAGRGISFLARSATVFYSHPEVRYVPIPELAPDQVCLAAAGTRASAMVDDFFSAAQEAAGTAAECGNYEMWR